MAEEVRAPGQGQSFPKLLKAPITTLRRNCYEERTFEEYVWVPWGSLWGGEGGGEGLVRAN